MHWQPLPGACLLNIFVVGSNRHLTEPAQVTKYNNFCTMLGETFARKCWTVLAGSVDEGTADHWVLRGMDDAAAEGKTIDAHVYRDKAVNENAFKRFRLEPHTDFSNMTVAHISAISVADVVVVIGGSKKTPGAAWAALALEKPVISLRQFGGASRDIWKDLHQEYSHALEKRNYNLLSQEDCEIRDLCEHTVTACEKLLTAAKNKGFSSMETLFYSSLALAFGILAFFLSVAEGHPLAWPRAVTITILSVFTGWLLAQLIARERKELLLTVPHAVMLSLVILAVVAVGNKMFEGIIDKNEAAKKAPQLLISLFGAGLLSGFSARTALLVWINKLSEKFKVPSSGHD